MREITQELMRLGLFDRLLTQIKEDMELTPEVVEELLTFIPIDNLIQYLPEEEWEQWYKLYKHVSKNPID